MIESASLLRKTTHFFTTLTRAEREALLSGQLNPELRAIAVAQDEREERVAAAAAQPARPRESDAETFRRLGIAP